MRKTTDTHLPALVSGTGWFLLSEQLPEKGQLVLVLDPHIAESVLLRSDPPLYRNTYDHLNANVMRFLGRDRLGYFQWVKSTATVHFGVAGSDEATLWMPLPEIPGIDNWPPPNPAAQ